MSKADDFHDKAADEIKDPEGKRMLREANPIVVISLMDGSRCQ
jgi:hypothetical protein